MGPMSSLVELDLRPRGELAATTLDLVTLDLPLTKVGPDALEPNGS